MINRSFREVVIFHCEWINYVKTDRTHDKENRLRRCIRIT